ncbi:beta-1 adrenergic receptor-like [Oculina patagonica]
MNISCFNERLSSAASIFLSLWFSLSGLAAVIGNAIVLWLFYCNRSLRTISNRFLASLCVADLLVGLLIDPTWIAIRFFTLPQNPRLFWMNIIDMLWIHTTAATVFNLCCVSVDRFIAIRFPFRYQDIINKKRCYIVITMVWLISLFLPFSSLLGDTPENRDKLWLSLTVITFVVPITVVILCYFWIFKEARKQARMIGRQEINLDENNKVRALQNYKALKTIGFVLGVFIVSWIPCLIISVVNHHDVTEHDQCIDQKLYFVVWPWIEAIAFTSSAINPWIYCFRNGEFREALRVNFRCCPCFNARISPKRKSDRNQKLGNVGALANKAFDETKL